MAEGRIIQLPEILSADNLFFFSRELDDFNGSPSLTIDLGQKRHFPPFALVFIAAKLKSFKEQNPTCKLFLRNYQHHSYPGHMGFFDMCGASYGKLMGQVEGSDNYIPITKIKKEELYERSLDRYIEVQDLIQRHVDRIARMFSRDLLEHKDMFDIISYSFREIFRNVFEHSEADELYYCSQFWPASGKLEVGVADLGIGIRKGLATNPNFRLPTDKDALEASLLPGVSGKTHLPRQSNEWFNSGYGLYMTNRLARHGGNFVIVSGKEAILLTSKNKVNHKASFPGTAIRLNLAISKIGRLQHRLSEFRQDGIKIAQGIRGSGGRPPSAMSLLIRRDYKEPT